MRYFPKLIQQRCDQHAFKSPRFPDIADDLSGLDGLSSGTPKQR